jgi:hypothetical protein
MMPLLPLVLLLLVTMKVLQPHCCYSWLPWGCLCRCHSLHDIRILFPRTYLKVQYFRPQHAELYRLSVKERSPSFQPLPIQPPMQ